jgi:hypothetical protein
MSILLYQHHHAEFERTNSLTNIFSDQEEETTASKQRMSALRKILSLS